MQPMLNVELRNWTRVSKTKLNVPQFAQFLKHMSCCWLVVPLRDVALKNCLPISHRIILTLSGSLPSVRYNPRDSRIEGKSRDTNNCSMSELRLAWHEKQSFLLQEGPVNRLVRRFHHSGMCGLYRCFLQGEDQQKSIPATHQDPGPSFTGNDVQQPRLEFYLTSAHTFERLSLWFCDISPEVFPV